MGDIELQIQSLVSRRIIDVTQAKLVDVKGIKWLMGSEAGDLLRRHAKFVRREIPVYIPLPPGPEANAPRSDDPLDRIMIRGRLDVLILAPEGSIILDYKTDVVSGEQIAERAHCTARRC